MKSFKNAYLKFLKRYKNKTWYEGAILCGSYATGNNDENSDIDIYIIANNKNDWRERGNCLIDGYMIEYFINPVKTIEEYFSKERASFKNHTVNMFVQGIIIDDINGNVENLIKQAKNIIKIKPKVNNYIYQMNCYSVWESFDELESKYVKSEDLDLSYYYFLECAMSTIAYNKGIGSFNINKIEKFLTDESFRKKYGIKKFFNKKDSTLILKCLKEKDYERKYKNAKEIYEHICKEFNFDINNFAYRSKI